MKIGRLLLLLIAYILLANPIELASIGRVDIVYIDVSEVGLAEITHIVNVTNFITEIKLLGTPEEGMILTSDESGLPVNYTVKESVLIAETFGVKVLNVTYLTYRITRMEGGVWYLNFTTDLPCLLKLPQGAILTYINRVPEEVREQGGRLVLLLASGEIEIQYMIPPEKALTDKESKVEKPLNGGGEDSEREPPESEQPQPQKTSPLESEGGEQKPLEGEQLQPWETSTLLLVVVVPALALVISCALLLGRRRRIRKLSGTQEVILDYLRKKGGGAFQEDVVRDLRLPKSTVSRAVGGLVREGLVEVRKVSRKNYIRIK